MLKQHVVFIFTVMLMALTSMWYLPECLTRIHKSTKHRGTAVMLI